MHRLPRAGRNHPKTHILVIQTLFHMNRLLLTVILLTRLLSAGAQTAAGAQANAIARANAIAQTNEKIFVHTDKEFYLAGEILWFKLYVVDAASHRQSALSKVAYVEIISNDQHPALQAKIALDEGLGNGSFQLPFSIHSGNYIFRAYTRWMINAGAEACFEKPVTILNTLQAPPVPATSNDSPAYDVQFFPEGGSLVQGLPNNIAFRIADRSGKGVSCKGAVINTVGDTIAHFHTLRFGMGRFSFTPPAGGACKAVLELDDHTGLTYSLPPAQEKGYTMQVTAGNDGRLAIAVRGAGGSGDTTVRLFVHNRKVILTLEQKTMIGGEARFALDEKQLPDGITVFTVLTGVSTPVGERLWFRRPAPLNMEIHADKEEYKTREKVSIKLALNGAGPGRDTTSATPLQLNASMAVVLQDSLQSTGQEDILNYLFLSSELKGAIESPAYYFSNDNPEVKETTDLLMMTQGWRRLSQTSSSSRHNPEYAGLLVTGKVIDRQTNTPASGIFAWLSVPGRKFRLASGLSNAEGELQWDLGKLYGAHELVIQTGDSVTDRRYRIDLFSPFASPLTQTTPSPFKWPTTAKDQLLTHSIGAQAQNAYQPDRHLHFSQAFSTDTLAFFGRLAKSYRLDDYTRFTTMEEVMREYVREVRVRNSKGNFEFYVQADQANQLFFETRPLVLVDGVPIPDFNDIIRFDPLKLYKIEIVAKRYLLGDSVYSGIINYSTYNGDLSGFPLARNAYILDYEGLQLHREFYSPLYETRDQQTSRIPDMRNILYWSPDITMNPVGKSEISFYTSDLPGRYTVAVQGITTAGQAGSFRTSFVVDRAARVK